MRKSFKGTFKSLFSIILTLLLLFSLLGGSLMAYAADFGSTDIYHSEVREIARGVYLKSWQGTRPNNTNKMGYTITFNPGTSDAEILAAFGNDLANRDTLSSLSWLVETQQNVSIIGGINGDFYHLSNGIPIGLIIQDGRLVSHSTTKWNAIGFKKDSSVVIGSPEIEMKAIIGEIEYPFVNLNKAQGDWGPYLYTADYGPNTGSTVPSIEVILDINMGQPAMGRAMVATVSEIRKNVKSTPIKPGQLVFSARIGKQGEYALSKFKVGDVVAFSFIDKSNQWTDVYQAVGGEKILIDNGAIVSGLPGNNYNPSTAVGVKANGDVVFFQSDGRSSISQGVSSLEIAQYLYNQGCVKAIQLDGGGSSAIIARMPGYRSPTLLNKPSDGRERANANGILLVSKKSIDIKDGKEQLSTKIDKLHIYPGKAYALPNAELKFTALATNADFFPVSIKDTVAWGSNSGRMDASGNLKINAKPGNYVVQASTGSANGTAEVIVLNDVTSIRPTKSVIYAQPGESVHLNCEAFYYNIKAAADPSSFNWKVEGNIGQITSDGVFTPTQGQGTGRIIAEYGSKRAYIDVIFPDLPDTIEDFENGANWGASSERAKSVNVSVVKDESLAKSGSGVLKVDYDFTLDSGVEKGIAGAYAYRVDPNTQEHAKIVIDKVPKAIGMWVYGDSSNLWLRARVLDGKNQSFYIDFTPEYRPDTQSGGINWNGWKYVEAKIPEGKQGPFTLDLPIRIMCTRDELRTKGTLYFDQIRAVYSLSEGDTLAPEINIVSPKNQSLLNENKVSLSAKIKDNSSGVDQKSIQVLLDGAKIPNLNISASNSEVSLNCILGQELPLADGLHTITFIYSDLMGNQGSYNLEFMVETGAPQVIISTSPKVTEGGTFTSNISIKNPTNLRKVFMDFKYDPSKVEVADVNPNVPGKQIALESWVNKGKIITHRVDETNGRIILEIDNLLNLSHSERASFGTITFKAKDTLKDYTRMRLLTGAMIVDQNPASQRFSLPVMDTALEYDFTLEVTGLSAGETTTIMVKDKNGNPVEGAAIYTDLGPNPLWGTDKEGKAVTRILTQLPKGTAISLRAIKGGLKSNIVNITIK